jgi:hypothetical protein
MMVDTGIPHSRSRPFGLETKKESCGSDRAVRALLLIHQKKGGGPQGDRRQTEQQIN